MITHLHDDVVMITEQDPTASFELRYPIPEGITYNSYVIKDEKTAILDTCDAKVSDSWLSHLKAVLGDTEPDVLVIHHMEPDHSSIIPHVRAMYPDIRIVASKIAIKMIGQFHGADTASGIEEVKEGDVLDLGKHKLRFVAAPQVHWPEVLMSFDEYDGSFYSADAFGRFGSPDPEFDWLAGGRRYYFNIVGKFGQYVQKLLAKASELDIKEIRPLHGSILKGDLSPYLGVYDMWSRYEPETDGVAVIYDTFYGHTRDAAHYAAGILRNNGRNVKEIDLSRDNVSYAIEAAFQYSEMLLASPTYETGLDPRMDAFLRELVDKKYQKRKVAMIENGSWAPQAVKGMTSILADAPDVEVIGSVKILSAMDANGKKSIEELVNRLRSGTWGPRQHTILSWNYR